MKDRTYTAKNLIKDIQQAYDDASKRNYNAAAQFYGQVADMLDKLDATKNVNREAPFALGLITRLGQI